MHAILYQVHCRSTADMILGKDSYYIQIRLCNYSGACDKFLEHTCKNAPKKYVWTTAIVDNFLHVNYQCFEILDDLIMHNKTKKIMK